MENPRGEQGRPSRDHSRVDFVLLNRRLATEDTPAQRTSGKNTVQSLLEASPFA